MTKPNVIIIYADDLGYGDLSCYGAEDVKTPNIDSLTWDGIKFTNAYSTSAVCTPARYSLLTGEYPFRNENTKILPGDANCIISKDKYTLPKMFQEANYTTGIIGKWHLGLSDGVINFNEEINHTPNDVGFDYSFIFPGTNDRVPCVYLKNRNVVNLDKNDPIEVSYKKDSPFEDIDTYAKNPEKLKMYSTHGHNSSIVNGVGRIGYMKGGKAATWQDEDLTDTFLGQVKEFISTNKENPFFMFYALHQPHVPRIPSKKFKGKSPLGPRGDVILELDYCVGEVKKHLSEQNLLEDTIIIFSSDNGPVLNDGYLDFSVEYNKTHKPAGPFRGGKYSRFEGGARIPFIVSWKNHMESKTSQALLSQVDLLSSFASMLQIELPENAAVDSENHLESFFGEKENGRTSYMFEHLHKAHVLREGKWAYLEPFSGEKIMSNTQTETGNSADRQLYNLEFDNYETFNVAEEYPNICEKMDYKMKEILSSSSTR